MKLSTLLFLASLAVHAAELPPIPQAIVLPPPRVNVTLSWNWWQNEYPSPPREFLVHYGPSNRFYTNFVSAGLSNQVTVSNLNADTKTYFAVVVITQNGLESGYSGEVIYIPEPLYIATNWVLTLTWTVAVTNNLSTPMKLFGLMSSEDGKRWQFAPAIQSVTRSNW